jgi:hypothetical protein
MVVGSGVRLWGRNHGAAAADATLRCEESSEEEARLQEEGAV